MSNTLTKIAMAPVRLADKVVTVGSFAAGAYLLAQAPQYVYQYTQNLSGRAQEALLNAKNHVNTPEYGADVQRADYLGSGLSAIRHANGYLEKTWELIRHFDWNTAVDTIGDFHRGFPSGLDGLAWAGAGGIVGIITYGMAKKIVGGIGKKIFKRN